MKRKIRLGVGIGLLSLVLFAGCGNQEEVTEMPRNSKQKSDWGRHQDLTANCFFRESNRF